MHEPKDPPRDRTNERADSHHWSRRRPYDWRYPLSGAARRTGELGPWEMRYDVREGYAEYHRLRRA